MAAWLKRTLPSLILDALVVLALVFPQVCAYLRWPLLALYAVISWALLRRLSASWWILSIFRDPLTRITHGLEHATLAVLVEDGLPALSGFTHGRDRFMVVLKAGDDYEAAAIRDAAARAIRRIRDGERSLAYHPGCGTSGVVSALSLWLVYATSLLFAFAVGGSIAIFFVISVVVFRLWLACNTSLGLLAQRLITVSTEFTAATVVNVHEAKVHKYRRPDNETWFELFVDVHVDASQGGLVTPGALA
jgi:hypothetical protein